MLCFGEICLISPFSNLLITNISTVAMVLGGAAALLPINAVTAVLRYPLFLAAGLISKLVIFLSGALARLPFASVGVDKRYCAVAVLAAVFILLAAVWVKDEFSRNMKTAAALICAVSLLVPFVNMFFNSDISTVEVLNVQNGTAIVVKNSKSTVVIGCGGGYNAYSRTVSTLDGEADLLLIPRNNTRETSGVKNLMQSVQFGCVLSAVGNEFFGEDIPQNVIVGNSGKASFGGISVEYINQKGISACFIKIGRTGLLTVFYPSTELSELPQNWLMQSRVLICTGAVPEQANDFNFSSIILSSDRLVVQDNVFSTAEYGSMVIRTRGDTAYQIRRDKNA